MSVNRLESWALFKNCLLAGRPGDWLLLISLDRSTSGRPISCMLFSVCPLIFDWIVVDSSRASAWAIIEPWFVSSLSYITKHTTNFISWICQIQKGANRIRIVAPKLFLRRNKRAGKTWTNCCNKSTLSIPIVTPRIDVCGTWQYDQYFQKKTIVK